MNYCGVLGLAFASKNISAKGKQEKDKWANWKLCQYLDIKFSSGPQGKFIYTVCTKGNIIERVSGANLGRLFRGRPTQCKDYCEIERIVKPKIVDREDLEKINMSEEEITILCGPKIIQ